MSQLIRQGHEVVPCLGGMQGAELMLKSASGRRYELIVRGVADSGRWLVNSEDESAREDAVYVLLNYKRFAEARSYPIVYVLPAPALQPLKEPHGKSRQALNFAGKKSRVAELDRWAEAWSVIQ
ncbi:hypothetical protein RQP53_01310 [Paucibacter sp. APW11]|uniref:Uncharacterized protein n=1 Tax=Roseateles aquae TaxID=3077235 RepID=A0ABU3P5Q3_9BURK|nr:hypothetical protein [Paucibacter sp. APW11]MDT8997908.1 hypothetical protein [Paucibacter sp. APW11]